MDAETVKARHFKVTRKADHVPLMGDFCDYCSHADDQVEYPCDAYQMAERVEELEARFQGHDQPCYYCEKQTSDIAGDPGMWSVALCHTDDPGKIKWHHQRCIFERLEQLTALRAREARLVEALKYLRKQFEPASTGFYPFEDDETITAFIDKALDGEAG